MEYWNILRILVTDSCNYRCVYCHNEGQGKEIQHKKISFSDFLEAMRAIEHTPIQEVRFSGGEPLLHPQIIDMIEWVDANTDYEVGLASNISLLTEEMAERLSKTRVLITVHFPGATEEAYHRVTKKEFSKFEKAVELLDRYQLSYSFNYVLHPELIENLEKVLEYSIHKKIRIKLLPFVEERFRNYSSDIMKNLKEFFIKNKCQKYYNKEQGFGLWTFKNGAQIKLLDSPCYEKNIRKCKGYGEIKLLPDYSLQTCLFAERIPIVRGESLEKQITNLWKQFNSCHCEVK